VLLARLDQIFLLPYRVTVFGVEIDRGLGSRRPNGSATDSHTSHSGKGNATIASRISSLTTEDWQWIESQSRSKILWLQLQWWQKKYYRDNPPNNRSKIQVPRKGSPEVPYERQIFYPSQHSRFSLGLYPPVAYFSSDFGVNCCETIEQFSSNEALSWDGLSQYLGGEGNPTPGWYGYPLHYHLADDSLILDLSRRQTPLLDRVREKFGQDGLEALWKSLRSRTDEEKKDTQLVAIEVRWRGYDGIIYASVRTPIDVGMPDRNLVMFSPDKVRSGLPPKGRFPRAGAGYLAWQASHKSKS